MVLKTIEWVGGIDGCAKLIDQTLLPGKLVCIDIRDTDTMWEAIKVLRVRGAPAIGIAAAYGVCLGLQTIENNSSIDQALAHIKKTGTYLATSRPTAVNLFWALDRMQAKAQTANTQNITALKKRNRSRFLAK